MVRRKRSEDQVPLPEAWQVCQELVCLKSWGDERWIRHCSVITLPLVGGQGHSSPSLLVSSWHTLWRVDKQVKYLQVLGYKDKNVNPENVLSLTKTAYLCYSVFTCEMKLVLSPDLWITYKFKTKLFYFIITTKHRCTGKHYTALNHWTTRTPLII